MDDQQSNKKDELEAAIRALKVEAIEAESAEATTLWRELAKSNSRHGRKVVDELEAEIKDLEAQRATASEQVNAERHRVPVSSHLEALRSLRVQAEAESPEQAQARSKIAAALRYVVDMVVCGDSHEVAVFAGGFSMNFAITDGKVGPIGLNDGSETVWIVDGKVDGPFPMAPILREIATRYRQRNPTRVRNFYNNLRYFLRADHVPDCGSPVPVSPKDATE